MTTSPASDRSLEALVDDALSIDDWEDDDRYWQIVASLQSRGDDDTFAEAVSLSHSATSAERRLGAHVLGQFGIRVDHPKRDTALPVLIDMAATNADDEVVSAVVTALGQLHDANGLQAVLRHATHSSARVRLHVAMAVPDLAGSPAHDDAVAALLRLSDDVDGAVRDWATFGLGTQMDVDNLDVRTALTARIADDDAVTSGEAIVGLARRRDARVLPHVLERLRSLALADYLIDAAAELGDPRFLPLLQDLQDTVGVFNGRAASLEEAIESCGGPRVSHIETDHPVGFRA